MTTRESELIELLHKEVKPALGCTEPIAVALAAAKATETLKTEVPVLSEYEVDVEVSGNILKNGMGVGIPGTGMVGLYIASALGAVCGKSEYGLEVLKDLTDKDVDTAKGLVDAGKVRIKVAESPKILTSRSRLVQPATSPGLSLRTTTTGLSRQDSTPLSPISGKAWTGRQHR